MARKHSTKKRRSGISRRTFFGAAAGSAALPFLRPMPAIAENRFRSSMLRDYVGRLCFNENPLGPSPEAMTAIHDQVSMGHRYSDWYAESLRGDLAELHGVSSSEVIAGCGATEILRLCAHAFADPAGNVVCPYPSYGQFAGDSNFLGASVRYAALDEDYRVDLATVAAEVDNDTTAVCITNANNPTGPVLPAADIAAFVDSLPSHVTVLIDEAYHEYIHDPGYESAMELARLGKNVVVIRTFSKVFGLAGIRIGYAVGKTELITSMRSWQLYATVNCLGLAGSRAALTDSQHVTDTVDLCDQTKAYCFTELDAMGVEYIPSETNFFMAHVGDGSHVASELAARGILVRCGWGMPEHIRVSTGTMQEMQDFITALAEILGTAGAGEVLIPKTTALDGNYPNPARGKTRISYSIARPGPVLLQVFDIHGRLIKTIVNESKSPGRYALSWNGTDQRGAPVAAGSYFYRLKAGDTVQTRRLILL
ncbi:MAG: aminotransferase class I/II-fold pyridoxal phosphate-dependent enzyme [Candidatus Eisenbacteria sp.]|nr:aminotransferase class I/II-fold pyridoxal phosphate-dependent enzyme [Candidatus Eisenbacteria bacterium]